MAGDAAREMHGEVGAAVSTDVAAKEARKLFFEQGLHGGLVSMARQERRKGGEEAVGEGRAVDALDNVGGGVLVFFFKILAKRFGQLPFEHIAHKSAPQHRAAAFVAKDKPEGRHVGADCAVQVKATVAACAENAGYTVAVATQGARRAKQVGRYMEFRRRKQPAQCFFHNSNARSCTPRSVEIYGGWGDARHTGQKFRLQDADNLDGGQHKGIDALRRNQGHVAVGRKHRPVGLGAAGIGN